MSRTILARLVLTGALTLFLAACSTNAAAPSGVASLGGDGATASDDPAASPSASRSPEDALLAFAQCMREHGVDMPDPQTAGGPGGARQFVVGGEGVDQEAFQEAQEACGEILGDAGVGRELTPADQDRILAFTECMREHGVDMPDPQFDSKGGGAVRIGDGDAIDPSSPEFQAAQEACSDILPFGGPKQDSGSGESGPSTDSSEG